MLKAPISSFLFDSKILPFLDHFCCGCVNCRYSSVIALEHECAMSILFTTCCGLMWLVCCITPLACLQRFISCVVWLHLPILSLSFKFARTSRHAQFLHFHIVAFDTIKFRNDKLGRFLSPKPLQTRFPCSRTCER